MGFESNITFLLILFYNILQASFAGSQNVFLFKHVSSTVNGEDYSYSYNPKATDGPQNWGNLNPKWKICGIGKRQSPIDIVHNRVSPPLVGDLIKVYESARATLEVKVHEVEVHWKENAGGIIINYKNYYNLVQCHWHSPSEHFFNGTRYNAELHLVHKNKRGDIAVVGIMYMFGPPDPFLQWLLPYIKSAGSEPSDLGVVDPWRIGLEDEEYYQYKGSLTTPPCSENVMWTLFKKVRTISQEQVRVLKEVVKDGRFGNARPQQQLNGRKIYYFRPPYFSSI